MIITIADIYFPLIFSDNFQWFWQQGNKSKTEKKKLKRKKTFFIF